MINYPDGRKYTSTQTPPKRPKKSKYGAVKTEVDGIKFDSKHEHYVTKNYGYWSRQGR